MARIQIHLPEHFAFATEVPIYITHINKAQHLDNSALLGLLSEARVRYFRALGYDELDVEGVGIVIADAALQYKSEAFHGEVMVFSMAPADFNKYGFDLMWQMADKATGREVARGKLGILFFDYSAKKAALIPDAFKAKIGAPA
ncbi:thioesterase family protein [Zoogloea sp.]|uniref:acyl-CoA thioesterase n=1 Tax=Zoogloea sp. TaxID=49181 RepID=UPI00263A030C|nr:thioesterase family protein [Zoogloea sp.]MDD3354903.1 thioesterase family protein [Zoogloea sp.]